MGEYDEQILFHGTNKLNLTGILRDDFRLTSNPINGSIYGRGIYFTNDIEKAMKDCQYVFHFAAQADIGSSSEDPTKTIHNNIIGTVSKMAVPD